MADLQTNLNENLIAAGLNPSDPANTYVDFAQQISKNQAEQAAQEQALALAKEHVKQAKFQSKNEDEASAAGYNPLLADSMTPEEAVAYLKIVMKAKGLEIAQDDIDAWAKTLPPTVNRQVVESFANRFARESTRSGQPVKFEKKDVIAIPAGSSAEALGLTEDPSDPKVGHVPEDGMYQVVYDNQGTIKKFIPGGKEPTDPSIKAAQKGADQNRKDWKDLNKQIDIAFKTRSGGLGSLSTAIFRAVRAINTINATENITSQDLANIAQDVAGIFQGGSPTVVTARDNDYRVMLLDMANWFRAQTGLMANVGHIFGKDHSPIDPTKRKLLQVCVDLRDSAINNLKGYAESEEAGYREAIESDPQRWEDMKHEKLKFIESGLLVPAEAKTVLNITGIEHSATPKNPQGKATPEGGMKLPSNDDIDAELARRQKEKK